MTRVLALVDGSPSSPAVRRSAASLATMLGAVVDPIHVRHPGDAGDDDGFIGTRTVEGDPETVLAAELAGDDVIAGVLGSRAIHAKPVGHVALGVISASPVPLVVLPPESSGFEATESRLLVPLDGSTTTSETLSPIVRTMCDAGAEVRIVHFFDSASLPPFASSRQDMEVMAHEFSLRHLPGNDADCVLRLGLPAQHIVELLDEHPADAIVVAWRQDLGHGRAEVIRRLLRESPIPLIIVPISTT